MSKVAEGGDPRFTPYTRPATSEKWETHPEVAATIDRVHEQLLEPSQVQTVPELLDAEQIPLPGAHRQYTGGSRSDAHALFVFTDLEPDDIFAIACHLEEKQASLVAPPVVVFTADLEEKDADGIFEWKLLMTAFCLGYDILKRMIIISTKGKALPTPYLTSAGLSSEEDCDAKLDQAVRGLKGLLDHVSEPKLQLLIIAPGRSHLGALHAKLQDDPSWAQHRKRASLSLYTGSFNIRGMAQKDLDFIVDTAKNGSAPLTDVAHFPYTGGDKLVKISNLGPFCPSLPDDLAPKNPYLHAAWKKYVEVFDKKLLDPFKEDHKLWGKSMKGDKKLIGDLEAKAERSEEEEAELAKLKSSLERDESDAKRLLELYNQSFWEYVRELRKAPILDRIGFKKRIVKTLADFGFHEGPVCDCLNYLNDWMLYGASSPGAAHVNVTNAGKWWVEFKDGRTGTGDPTTNGYEFDETTQTWWIKDRRASDERKPGYKECKLHVTDADAILPVLENPSDEAVVDAMSNELLAKVLKSSELPPKSTKAVDKPKSCLSCCVIS